MKKVTMRASAPTTEPLKEVKITAQQLIDIGSGKIDLSSSSEHPLYQDLLQAHKLDCSKLYNFEDSQMQFAEYKTARGKILAENVVNKINGFIILADLVPSLLYLKQIDWSNKFNFYAEDSELRCLHEKLIRAIHSNDFENQRRVYDDIHYILNNKEFTIFKILDKISKSFSLEGLKIKGWTNSNRDIEHRIESILLSNMSSIDSI